MKFIILFWLSISYCIGQTTDSLSHIPLGKNICSLVKDKFGNFWLASNGDGLYQFDGKKLHRFTEKDGLCSNYIWNIKEDELGTIWLGTAVGVCRYNGKTFEDFSENIQHAIEEKIPFQSNSLLFGQLNFIAHFNGEYFSKFVIHPDDYERDSSNLSRPYSVYSSFIDATGIAWFGTQNMGVCKYDGTATFLNEMGLKDAAVRAVFQDNNGVMWFGNNGAGLFRYDGITLSNFTNEKKLGNPNFLINNKVVDLPNSLARVFAINEDKLGNLWIGTIDAGLWKYDGKNLSNYTIKDGLTSNAIWTIYKDRFGELYFVTGGETVYKIDGNSFIKLSFD
ncbi:MAG: two-component regulator propeller domain-containing protein [Saprospiraceae bacterium]